MRTKKAKAIEVVKLTPGGRVSVVVARAAKPDLIRMLEGKIETSCIRSSGALDCEGMMSKALIEEVYKKYYHMLHVSREGKMQLSPAQAFAFIEVLYDYQSEPPFGLMFMQLHQRLITLVK